MTTSRILVMEYIEGMPIDHRNELLELDYDVREISEKMAENYVKQMLDDGFFHAAPYRGNLCIKDGKIVWIDWGILFGISALGAIGFFLALVLGLILV